jgi:choline-sulfatase
MVTNKRPNLLLIMTDQQRGDCLGSDGHPVVETPMLDELAAQGTRFRHAYSACPSCVPARASLMTGMSQWRTGILGMGAGQGPMAADYLHTLPSELAASGYHTQGIGKMHFHPQRALNGFHNTILDESLRVGSPGFRSDYMSWFDDHKVQGVGPIDHGIQWNSWVARPTHLPEYLHPTHWTAEQGIQWLRRRDPNKPFFLKLSFARPHTPFDPPPFYYEMYRDALLPEPYIGDWSHIHDNAQDAAEVNAWRGRRTEAQIRRARACYYGSISFIDSQISRLSDDFKRTQIEAWRNTLIIFCSDHGEMLGDHNLWRKTYAYEGSARIPMIVRPPDSWDVPRGDVRDEVVELRDVMPTFLEAAGLPVPDTCDGVSMLPLARGERPEWRTYLQGEHSRAYSEEQAMFYLTDGREKYIWFPYLGTEQFFDLTTDPGECHDLSAREDLQQRVSAWRGRLTRELCARNSDMVRDGRLVTQSSGQAWTSTNYGRFACASAAGGSE